MRNLVLIFSCMAVLTACNGVSKKEFLKNPDNLDKYESMQTKLITPPECETLKSIKDKDKLSEDDVITVLSYVGISKKDMYNMDKVLNTDFSKIDEKCNQFSDEIDNEEKNNLKYCEDKYYNESVAETVIYFPYRLVAGVSAITIIGGIPFALMMPKKCEGGRSLWHPVRCSSVANCKSFLNEGLPENVYSYGTIEYKIDKFYKDYQEKTLTAKEKANEQAIAKLNICTNEFTKGCLVDLSDVWYVSDYGTRNNGVLISVARLSIFKQYFVYDTRDYYDGQKFKDDGYYYQYTGNYNSGIQKVPAFKRSNQRLIK